MGSQITDAMTGATLAVTHTFAFMGDAYEITLAPKSARDFEAALGEFIAHAREVTPGGGVRTRRAQDRQAARAPAIHVTPMPAGVPAAHADAAPPNGQRTPRHGNTDELRRQQRVWARANGYSVSDRGRIPAHIIRAYNDAHGITEHADA